MSGQFHDSAATLPGEKYNDTHGAKLCGLQSRFWRFAERKKLTPLPEVETQLLGCPARGLVTLPTSTTRLPITSKVRFHPITGREGP